MIMAFFLLKQNAVPKNPQRGPIKANLMNPFFLFKSQIQFNYPNETIWAYLVLLLIFFETSAVLNI